MKATEFNQWVSDNNISNAFEYSKGWWDFVEFVQRLADRFDFDDVQVVGSHVVETMPPCERLPMPVVAINTPAVKFVLQCDFGAWSAAHDLRDWVVSVRRRAPYAGPLLGLFSDDEDVRADAPDGIPADLLFGPYRENQAQFTCLLRDEWDVVTLIRLLIHAA